MICPWCNEKIDHAVICLYASQTVDFDNADSNEVNCCSYGGVSIDSIKAYSCPECGDELIDGIDIHINA